MAIVLALLAALSWGTSDFVAGVASRRLSVPLVLILMECSGLAVALTITLATHEPYFSAAQAAQAVGAGIAGVLGLGCFYRALAIGTMSVVAPISATGVALPVVVGLATGDRPSAAQALGLVAIVLGVVLASREQHADVAAAQAGRTALMLALLSAVGFGGFFALTDAPADGSILWTVVITRLAPMPFVLVLLSRIRPPRPSRRLALVVLAAGTVDLAATACIAAANTKGDVSVVSVLGGMYPVVTVLLAAAVLHERLRASQLAGVGTALGGVALVVAG
jgi:drug/metabolite transporter (DMT)-like permease